MKSSQKAFERVKFFDETRRQMGLVNDHAASTRFLTREAVERFLLTHSAKIDRPNPFTLEFSCIQHRVSREEQEKSKVQLRRSGQFWRISS